MGRLMPRSITICVSSARSGISERRFPELHFNAERAEQIVNCRFGILLRLIQDAHLQGGLADVGEALQPGLMLQIRIVGHPWRPPSNVAVPDLSLLLIEIGVEQSGRWKCYFDGVFVYV